MKHSKKIIEIVMAWIRGLVKYGAFFIYISLASFFILEIIFRFLPVSESLKLQAVNEENPYAHFLENRTVRQQIGFNFSHITYKRSNNYGFLSSDDYTPTAGDAPKIAVIGDSYVEAIQVANDKTFHDILAKQNPQLPIYALGISGAPLSQYLAYAHFAEQTFNPSHYIFVIISNDFDESWLGGRKNRKGFHYFNSEEQLVRKDYTPSIPHKTLRQSAFFNYLHLDLKLHVQIARMLRGKNTQQNTQDAQHKKLQADAIRSVPVFLRKLKKLVGDKPVLFVLDGDREAIYTHNSPKRNEGFWPNAAYQKLIEEAPNYPNFKLLDMHAHFYNQWMSNKQQKFEYPYDWHWNSHGHRTVAQAIEDSLFIPK